MNSKNKLLLKKVDFIAGLSIILLIVFIFVIDGVNSIQYQLICYDEGYNATVAANLFRYGEYRVSYPDSIVFYNRITTGPAVLVPTAILYSVFGISNLTSSIVALVYGALSIVLLWILFVLVFGKRAGQCSLSAALVVAAVAADLFLDYNSTHLIGESACLFFLLLCFICVTLFYRKNKGIFMVLAGAALAGTFLTKSSMIFFVVTLFGVVFTETVFTKTISWKQALGFLLGFALGILIFDAIKLFYLGGVSQYIQWWKNEWKNMLSQSSGIDTEYSIRAKVDCLAATFGNNWIICGIYVALPVVFYATHFFYYLFRKKYLFSKQELSIVYAGLSGTSLLVYFILLGGSGLAYGRRLSVNVFLTRVMMVFYIGYMVWHLLKSGYLFFVGKNSISITAGGRWIILCSVVAALIWGCFPVGTMRTRINEYLTAKTEKDYEYQMMEEFLTEIEALGEDAVLYCYGWWQEPDISLFLNKTMIDITSVDTEEIDKENGYFIIGRRFDRRTTEEVKEKCEIDLEVVKQLGVDYDRLWAANSYELFSIYKIN